MVNEQEGRGPDIRSAWEKYLKARGIDPKSVPPEVILNSRYTPVQGTEIPDPMIWLHAPATIHFLKASWKIILETAKARGLDTNQVVKVRAARLPGLDEVFVYGTDKDDLDGILVRKYRGKLTVNIRSLLEPAGRRVETGYRALYAVEYIPDSPVGPAMVFDVTNVLKRRRINESDDEAEAV